MPGPDLIELLTACSVNRHGAIRKRQRRSNLGPTKRARLGSTTGSADPSFGGSGRRKMADGRSFQKIQPLTDWLNVIAATLDGKSSLPRLGMAKAAVVKESGARTIRV